VGRSFVLAQDEPVARGAPQLSFSISQRDFNQAGILSRRSLAISFTCA
jgi:hypothetical protein